MIYLFLGQDNPSKDIKLKQIKKEFLNPGVEEFNLDILYGRELSLRVLQERLLCLPVKIKKRLIVIKGAEVLKDDIKEFLLKYVKKPSSKIILVLDTNKYERKDEFINSVSKFCQIYRFKETVEANTFSLSQQIDLKRADYALRVLNQLLKNGEKPERILGGLRYAWERDIHQPIERRKRLRLLLNCDSDIKTGRLKAHYALERLVVSLCCLNKPFS